MLTERAVTRRALEAVVADRDDAPIQSVTESPAFEELDSQIESYLRHVVDASATSWYLDRCAGPQSDVLRRAIGLLAYLVGDGDTSNRLWSLLQSRLGEDPLVDAALGMVVLGIQQPGQATAMLGVAVREFPDCAFLRVRLADAWLQVGAGERARRHLEEFRALGVSTEYEEDLLVEADLVAWEGDFQRSLALHQRYGARHVSTRSALHAFEISRHAGDPLSGLRTLSYFAIRFGGKAVYVRTLFAQWFREWWSALSPRELLDQLTVGMSQLAGDRISLAEMIRAYGEWTAEDSDLDEIDPVDPWTIPQPFLERLREISAAAPVPFSARDQICSLDQMFVTAEMLELEAIRRQGLSNPARRGLIRFGLLCDTALATIDLDGHTLPRAIGRGLAEAAVTIAERMSDPRVESVAGDLLRIHGTQEGSSFGASVDAVGDWSGDGISEVLVGSPNAEPDSPSRAFVHNGRTGLEIRTISEVVPADRTGRAVAAMDDLDGDGLRDIAIGSPMWSIDHPGVVRVFRGGMDEQPGRIHRLEGANSEEKLGWPIASTGDCDGDGVGDLLVGGGANGPGFRLYSGRSGEVIRIHRIEEVSGWFGVMVAASPDFDLDGSVDYAGSAWSSHGGRVVVFSGANGRELAWLESDETHFGRSVLIAAVDQDERPDIVVGAASANTEPGKVVALSGEAVMRGERAEVWRQTDSRSFDRWGSSVISARRDFDGDGVPDLLVGAPGSRIARGSVALVSAQTGQTLFQVHGGRVGASFGDALATTDLDGDGGLDLIVGAPRQTNRAGLGSVFFLETERWNPASRAER